MATREQEQQLRIVGPTLQQASEVFASFGGIDANENLGRTLPRLVAGGVETQRLAIVCQGVFVAAAADGLVAAPDQPLHPSGRVGVALKPQINAAASER